MQAKEWDPKAALFEVIALNTYLIVSPNSLVYEIPCWGYLYKNELQNSLLAIVVDQQGILDVGAKNIRSDRLKLRLPITNWKVDAHKLQGEPVMVNRLISTNDPKHNPVWIARSSQSGPVKLFDANTGKELTGDTGERIVRYYKSLPELK